MMTKELNKPAPKKSESYLDSIVKLTKSTETIVENDSIITHTVVIKPTIEQLERAFKLNNLRHSENLVKFNYIASKIDEMVTLLVKRDEFEAIKAGTKKIDWRSPSKFNKKLLLKKNEDGLFSENKDIKEICFRNGRSTDSPKIIVEVEVIRPYKFVKDVDEPHNLFKGNAGESAIGVHISRVKNL